jgi:hypothetical protein
LILFGDDTAAGVANEIKVLRRNGWGTKMAGKRLANEIRNRPELMSCHHSATLNADWLR